MNRKPRDTSAGAVYARIIRAILDGRGICLTAAELANSGIDHDDAAIMAALGGDCDDGPPEWLTPTERRRYLDAMNNAESDEHLYVGLFRPARERR